MSRAMMMCLLATSLAVGVGCAAQSPRVIAQRLYDQMNQSKANHDLNRWFGFLDSSYVCTNERGKRETYAEVRRWWEQNFRLFRAMNPNTTVDDVQLDGDRMFVHFETKSSLQVHNQQNDWIPLIENARGQDTWEKKRGQWKLVRSTIDSQHTQRDPKWVEEEKARAEENRKDWEMAQRVVECCDSRRH